MPFASRSVAEVRAHLANVSKALYEYRWEGKMRSGGKTAGAFVLTALPFLDDVMRYAESREEPNGFRLLARVEVRAGHPKDIVLVAQTLARVSSALETGAMRGYVIDHFSNRIGSFRR